jgi:hypothetical protein
MEVAACPLIITLPSLPQSHRPLLLLITINILERQGRIPNARLKEVHLRRDSAPIFTDYTFGAPLGPISRLLMAIPGRVFITRLREPPTTPRVQPSTGCKEYRLKLTRNYLFTRAMPSRSYHIYIR